MPNPAPGAERLAGGVEEDTAPAASARLSPRVWRWAGVAVFLLVIVAAFDAYLHLSKTYQENSDEANILLPGIRWPAKTPVLAGGPPPTSPARRGAPRRHSLRIRLVAAPLVVLFGWYSYGLFRQADTPAAPDPLTNVAALLEKYHLSYGLGGYWEASVLTVETGGAVTIRAVQPACLQQYPWESKTDWYHPPHVANFILLSNLKGYFTSSPRQAARWTCSTPGPGRRT